MCGMQLCGDVTQVSQTVAPVPLQNQCSLPGVPQALIFSTHVENCYLYVIFTLNRLRISLYKQIQLARRARWKGVREIKLARLLSSVVHLPRSATRSDPSSVFRFCALTARALPNESSYMYDWYRGVHHFFILQEHVVYLPSFYFLVSRHFFNFFFSGCQALRFENRWSKAIMILTIPGIKRELTSLHFRS
jgi:hypothetical protein